MLLNHSSGMALRTIAINSLSGVTNNGPAACESHATELVIEPRIPGRRAASACVTCQFPTRFSIAISRLDRTDMFESLGLSGRHA